MLRASELLHARMPHVQFLLSEANSLPTSLYDPLMRNTQPSCPIQRVRNQSFEILHASDFALVSSGTATLEATVAGTPFLILYKTAWSTFFLGRRLIKIPYIGLVNVVAGRKIVPEFIQHGIRTDAVAQEGSYLLESQDLREKMISDLKAVREQLGEPGAARRAARVVLEFLNVEAAAPALPAAACMK